MRSAFSFLSRCCFGVSVTWKGGVELLGLVGGREGSGRGVVVRWGRERGSRFVNLLFVSRLFVSSLAGEKGRERERSGFVDRC